MRVGSLFSGVGGFDLGFERAGFEVAWQCEINPHARAVLARHWPEVPCYADVREVNASAPAVDVLVGGFPCQDISVAGKRAGLAGDRSGLWFEFRRVVSELRPEWVVIENVPGLRSSGEGRDLATIVSGLVELGYLGAWWSPDAQYVGLAQRRERMFIVGHLGAGGGCEVLLEPESLRGDPPSRREAGEAVAGTLGGSSQSGGFRTTDLDNNGAFVLSPTLTAENTAEHAYRGDGSDPLVVDPQQATSAANRTHPTAGFAPPLTPAGRLAVFQPRFARNGRGAPDELAYPLTAEAGRTGKGDSAQVVFGYVPEIHPTLDVGAHPGGLNGQGAEDRIVITAGGYVPPIVPNAMSAKWSKGAGGPAGDEIQNLVAPLLRPRRLTPTECERLQGFPDGWTAGIKANADTHRYRQLGNAVAVPVAEWIARRLMAVGR